MKRRGFLKQTLLLPLLNVSILGKESALFEKYKKFSFKKMHKNLYIMEGNNDHKLGLINNPSFIESKNGIIVIDAGGSYEIGCYVLKKIQEISLKPIIAIFTTHNHSDHWFATGALKERYPNAKIYGHKNMEEAAKMIYFGHIGNVQRAKKLASPIFFPNRFVKDKEQLAIDGEQFKIRHPSFAHTNSDITIEHLNSNTFFCGDLVLRDILADFGRNSSILGNLHFLEQLRAKKEIFKLYVPGHGHVGSKEETLDPYYRFLKIIEEEAQDAKKSNLDFFDLHKKINLIIQKIEWEDIEGFDHSFIPQYLEHLFLEITTF